MTDTLMAEQQQTPVFEYRQPPTKRRKFIRKRLTSDDEDDSLSNPRSRNDFQSTSHATNTDDIHSTNEDGGLGANASNLAELARLRKKAARARQGLQLAVPTAKPTEKKRGKEEGAGEEISDEQREEERLKEEELARITGRFTQQTGQILDVDKHMMEYIEKKMSSKNATTTSLTYTTSSNQFSSMSISNSADRPSRPPPSSASESNSHPSTPDPTCFTGTTTTTTTTNPQPTDPRFGSDVQMRGVTLGKLHEVDLGEETRMRNIARTEAATRRLEGKDPIQEEEESKGGKKKGKWKRRRRNSQDLQRDKLVEEVLKETRLELYDEVEKEEEQVEDEGATDDRIVEKFRKEFLDAMNLKRGRRRPTATTKKDDKAKPRGPKLGGSRMARAAMREAQVGTAAGKK